VDINNAKPVVFRSDDHGVVQVFAFHNVQIIVLGIDRELAVISGMFEARILDDSVSVVHYVGMEKLAFKLASAFSEIAVFKQVNTFSSLINAEILAVQPY